MRPLAAPSLLPGGQDLHQQLLAAIATQRVVHLRYQAGHTGTSTERDTEPIGLYMGKQWHVIAYCQLRQEFRDFRLDRIAKLQVQEEVFTARPETLQQYWQTVAAPRPKETAVVRFTAAAARQVQDVKLQYGWAHEQLTASGDTNMTFMPTCLHYLARWLLAYPGQVTVLSPPKLQHHLVELARAAYHHFCASSLTGHIAKTDGTAANPDEALESVRATA